MHHPLHRQILLGDVLEQLKNIPDESIDCLVTSPPYYGLRDYKVDGQWGLENTFHDYLKKMRLFMKDVRRIIKPTGTVFVNLGDTYGGTTAHSDWSGVDEDFNCQRMEDGQFQSKIYKPHLKSRLMVPERFGAQCVDDGWIIRNHIPWIKENAMPTSVKDRFQNKWESIFFMTKKPRYYFNLDAVRVTPKTESRPFNRRVREVISGKAEAKMGTLPLRYTASEEELQNYNKLGERIERGNYQPGERSHFGTGDDIRKHMVEARLKEMVTLDGTTPDKPTDYTHREGEPRSWASIKTRLAFKRLVEGREHDTALNHPLGKNPGDIIGYDGKWDLDEMLEYSKNEFSIHGDNQMHPLGKNPGDVLKITTRPYIEAHFATFPVDLPLFFLRCGCPPGGTVLDPFFGAGTVAVAAEMLSLDWVGIELNANYIEIAKKRLKPFMFVRLEDFVSL